MVEAVCTACHSTSQITRSMGYTQAGWQALTATMVDLSGDPAQRDQIIGYLAAHFPPNDVRAPTLVPGEAEIAFKEWVVPTLGQRSRDPVEAADGVDLVGRAMGQPGRADRPGDRGDDRVPPAAERDAAFGAAR